MLSRFYIVTYGTDMQRWCTETLPDLSEKQHKNMPIRNSAVDMEDLLNRKADERNLLLTPQQQPKSEDVSKYYPNTATAPSGPTEEVKGYLRMREAKLMETLWEKEKALRTKVNDYVHHRTLERNSVDLQTGRIYRPREPVPAVVRASEANRMNLTLQPPAAMPLLRSLLDEGCRSDVELAPKVSMLDELRELQGWGPDKMASYLAESKLSSLSHSPGVENYIRQLRALDNLREERRSTPHAHKSSEPVLLNAQQSKMLLGVLETSKISPERMMEILRDMPLAHEQKAEFIKNLDVGPLGRVELLRELPYSKTREVELLRELPLDPIRKLEFLRGLPLDSGQKAELMTDLGLPESTPDMLAMAQESSLSGTEATTSQMGLSDERRAALFEEMRMHDFVESEIARNFTALQESPLPLAEKLQILKQLQLSEKERGELNRRLGFPIDQSEIKRDLGA